VVLTGWRPRRLGPAKAVSRQNGARDEDSARITQEDQAWDQTNDLMAHLASTGQNHCAEVLVFDPANKLADTGWHPHVVAIVRVERNVYTRNAKTGLLRQSTETAFYVANTPVTAARAAEAVRAHWKIETTLHYTHGICSPSCSDERWAGCLNTADEALRERVATLC